MHLAQVAFDADNAYFRLQGENLDSTVGRIEFLFAQVAEVFARDVQITMEIPTIIVRETPFYAVDGDGGEIRVKTGLLEDISTDDPSLYLEVNDNGYGMDASAKAQAFGPCFTTKAVGRGLGLAAVEGIARGHGGSVEVASDLGVGTRVRVSLPVTSSS